MAPLPFSWRVGRSSMIEGTIFQGSPFNSSGRWGGDQDHFEGTRPVYTLYSVELNIAGGARPADHGQWPGRLCSGDRLRHTRHDHILIHDAEVIVGDKGDGSPALVGRCIEDERPGFGDGSRAPGDHALHSIKITNCQGILWLVPDYLGCCLRQPCIWHSHG